MKYSEIQHSIPGVIAI